MYWATNTIHMKKNYSPLILSFLFCLMVTLGFGQTLISPSLLNPAGHAKHGTPSNYKAVTATLTCNSTYAANSTTDLSFTLRLSNTDEEYGDSLSITFPAGITPISTPNNPIYTSTDTSAHPEVFRGINGQTIVWGDNDNSYGGLVALVNITFTVKVNIAAGVTGVQTGNFFVSGDTYKNPKDFSGTFTINPAPTAPDLQVIGFAPYATYATPLNHAYKTTLGAAAINNGLVLSENVNMLFYGVPGGFNDSKPLPNPLAAATYAIVESDSFDVSSPGPYSIWYDATFPNDANNLDNKDTVDFIITDNYFSANDNDTVGASSLGLTSPGSLGSLIQLEETDTITVVNALFNSPTPGSRATASIYGYDTTTSKVTTLLATSQTVTLNGKQYVDFTLNKTLGAGFYVISIDQLDSANYGLASTFDNYLPGYYFVKFGAGAFSSLENIPASFRRTFYIRTFTAARGNVGIAENISSKVNISPNPSNGFIRIAGVENANYTIIDNLGRTVQSGEISQGNHTISINALQSGNYIVRLESNTGVAYKQISLVK